MISHVKMDRFCKFTGQKIIENVTFFGFDTLVTVNVNPAGQPIFKVSSKNTKTMTHWVFACLKLAHLNHFMPLISFCTTWNHQKTRDFLMFLGGKERDQWHEIG